MSTRSSKKRASAAADIVEHIRAAAFVHAEAGALLVQSAKADGVPLAELQNALKAVVDVVNKARQAEQRLACHGCRKSDPPFACVCGEWAWCDKSKCVGEHRCPGGCGCGELDESEESADVGRVVCDSAECSVQCEYCYKRICRSCEGKTVCDRSICRLCEEANANSHCCNQCEDY